MSEIIIVSAFFVIGIPTIATLGVFLDEYLTKIKEANSNKYIYIETKDNDILVRKSFADIKQWLNKNGIKYKKRIDEGGTRCVRVSEEDFILCLMQWK